MTKPEIMNALDRQWHARSLKVSWTDYENTAVAIFEGTDTTDAEKLALAKEALDAYTRRGHFTGQYLDDYQQTTNALERVSMHGEPRLI